MSPQIKGACGHCGGTGFDIGATSDHTSFNMGASRGATSSSQDNNWPDDTIIQYPVMPGLWPPATDNYPFIPAPDTMGPSVLPTNSLNWSDQNTYNPAQVFDELLASSFDEMNQTILSSGSQLYTPPLPQFSDFDLADNYSALYSSIPELDMYSDMDTTLSLTPEELRSPLELVDSPAGASPSDNSNINTRRFKCDFCSATYPSKPKLNVHIKKHTKPHKCTVPGCGYEAAEKKSLHRHVAAGAKWDRDHELAAQRIGVRRAEYSCRFAECTYAGSREDNRKRHEKTCPHRPGAGVEEGEKDTVR